jgi:hypothetical protein
MQLVNQVTQTEVRLSYTNLNKKKNKGNYRFGKPDVADRIILRGKTDTQIHFAENVSKGENFLSFQWKLRSSTKGYSQSILTYVFL